jgi:NADPH-dependent ferric siderophore reductase
MQRLRFIGQDLRHFATNDNLHVRLHFPAAPPNESVETRYYTIRRIDADEGWFDVDFVLHDDGPGSNFARFATPGAACGVSGPCGLGIKPAHRYLLAGDETALPAMARIAETLPRDAGGHILIEVPLSADRTDIDAPRGMTVKWFCRDASEETPTFLDRLSHAVDEYKGWQDSFLWIAGEHDAVMPLRKILGRRPSLCVPYWRRGS